MDSARIAALLAPFLPNPPKDLIANISTYIDILLRWNARINLTAIRDPDQIVTRHFGESLFAARLLFAGERDGSRGAPLLADFARSGNNTSQAAEVAPTNEQAREGRKITLADLGSGAGFPGIPIKLYAPHLSLTLIESNHKKATFLREVTRALTLTDINIQSVRAEALPPATFDIVTLRAVERFESMLPVGARLVAPQGRLALLIGASQVDSARATLPHLHWSDPIPFPRSHARAVVIAKTPKA